LSSLKFVNQLLSVSVLSQEAKIFKQLIRNGFKKTAYK